MIWDRLSGLPNLWLANGYRRERTVDGPVLIVERPKALDQAVARDVAAHGALGPAELRFLRGVLELSQSEFAARLGSDIQAVARWEKGRARLPGPAETLIRAMVLIALGRGKAGMRLIASGGDASRPSRRRPSRAVYKLIGGTWRRAEGHAASGIKRAA